MEKIRLEKKLRGEVMSVAKVIELVGESDVG